MVKEQPLRRGPAPITAERLLAAIECDQRATGACTATTSELAERVGRHPRHIQATLQLLDHQGLIVRDWIAHPTRPGHTRRRLRLRNL